MSIGFGTPLASWREKNNGKSGIRGDRWPRISPVMAYDYPVDMTPTIG